MTYEVIAEPYTRLLTVEHNPASYSRWLEKLSIDWQDVFGGEGKFATNRLLKIEHHSFSMEGVQLGKEIDYVISEEPEGFTIHRRGEGKVAIKFSVHPASNADDSREGSILTMETVPKGACPQFSATFCLYLEQVARQ